MLTLAIGTLALSPLPLAWGVVLIRRARSPDVAYMGATFVLLCPLLAAVGFAILLIKQYV